MSLFFDKRLPVPASAGSRIFSDIKWHRIQPLLAFSVYDDRKGGLVSIYDHSKEETCDVDSSPHPGIQVTCICWHPFETFLAIGYESGEVTIWNHVESETFEGTTNHVSSILIMEWSPCGSLLISADGFGSLVVWASNSQGHLQPKATHDFKEAVCQLVFRRKQKDLENKKDTAERSLGMMTSWRPKTANRRDGGRTAREVGGSSNEISFFVGLYTGAIFCLKENGSSEEVLTSGSPVKCLLYHQAKDILIVMTDAAILGQFEIDNSGALREINKIKLSGKGHSLSWAGVGILAIISEDLSVRLWDVESGENFVLEPKGTNYSNDECFISVDYNVKTGHLCCNTNKGKLVVWRETTSSSLKDSDASIKDDDERWEWCSTFPVSSATKMGRWCQNVPDLLAINAVRDIFVLQQREIIATFHDKVSIMQTLATQLSIQMFEDKIKFDLSSEMQIKGFSNTKSHICIWSGSQVETYQIGRHVTNNYKLCGSFADKSETIHLFEQNLFILESLQIQVRSFIGVLKQTLTFSASEGPPITLAGAGEFITSATANCYLKIWHVGQREAKLHAAPKNMKESVSSLGEIIQAKNNLDGTRVAFTVARNNLLPDSRFFVWELNSGVVTCVKFPGQFVSKVFWEPEDSLYTAVELKVIPAEIQEIEDTVETPVSASSAAQATPAITTNPTILEQARRIMLARAAKERKKAARLQTTSNPEAAAAVPPTAITSPDYPVPDTSTSSKFKKPIRAAPKRGTPGMGRVTAGPASLTSRTKEVKRVIEQTRGPYLTTAKPPDTERPKTSMTNTGGSTGRSTVVDRNAEVMENIKRNRLQSVEHAKAGGTPTTGKSVGKTNLQRMRENFKKAEGASPTTTAPSRTATSTRRLRERRHLPNPTDEAEATMITNEIMASDVEGPANQIRTLFICAQKGILTHEKILIEGGIVTLLGLDVPYWYFLNKTTEGSGDRKNLKLAGLDNSNDTTNLTVERRFINDFQGVDEYSADDKHKTEIKKALLSYVYHNVSGDVDKALKAMRNIRNPDIWKNMARLCVKSKRVDVAGLCFARMNSAASARALKLCEGQDLDSKVAMVALQLNMTDEAEALYRTSGGFEQWLKVLKICEKWDQAIELCEKHCRIQLRTTYYDYAKYLEKEGRIEEAIVMYEKSGNHRYEVTRMLHSEPDRLEKYVLEKKEKELFQWWAQYLESTKEFTGAVTYYEMAEDWFSLTRLLCFCDDIDKAVLVAESVKDKASCFHIAGRFSAKGENEKAVTFYTKAQAYGAAMRICKENEMVDSLWRLSLMGDPHDQLEAALYFETRDPPDYEKAALLYHKSGYGSKAMDLAISTEQFGALQEVARDLIAASASGDQKADPEVLRRCAEYFVEHKQFDKALDMYATAHSYYEAMEMCVEYKIPINEEMAERLTPPKGAKFDQQERRKLLEKMAECCMFQGNYHLAAKKFTEANNKVEAMRVLIKSGDTDRIIFFANIARHKDVYVLAANFLQIGTEWQKKPALQQQIVDFYNKAHSPESVVTFYESWARNNFEAEKNYELSLENLRHAEKHLQEMMKSIPDAKSYDNRLKALKSKIQNVVKFLALRQMLTTHAGDAVDQLRDLLNDPYLEQSVSRGEVYGLIVEHYTEIKDHESAIEVLKEMKRQVPVEPTRYVKPETLKSLNQAAGPETYRIDPNAVRFPARRGSLQPYQEMLASVHDGDTSDEGAEEIEYVEVDDEDLDEEVEEIEIDEDENQNQASKVSTTARSFGFNQPTFKIN